MLKTLANGALFGKKKQQGELGYFSRLWIRTSSSLSSDAETKLLSTFLDTFRSTRIYIELEHYGLQFINTYVLKTTAEEREKDRAIDSAVVLTHGYGGGAGMFYHTLSHLGKNRDQHVYALDWLGMGRSSRPTSGLMSMSGKGYPQRPFLTLTRKKAEEVSDECISYFVESLELWRKAMNISKLQLVGHSLGGYLSARYALAYPERVEKLVLLSPVGVPDLPSESKEEEVPEFVKRNRFFTTFISTMWRMNVTPQSVVRIFGPWGPQVVRDLVQKRFEARGLNPDECNILADYLYHINVDKASGEYALNALLTPVMKTDHPGVYARRPLANDLLRGLPSTIPLVFIFGDRDWMFHPQVRELVETMPNAELKIVDRAGHHVYFDNPEGFNATLARVLS